MTYWRYIARVAVGLCSALLLSGCASNVLFLSRAETGTTQAEPATGIFFDRSGDLYPSANVPVQAPLPGAQLEDFFRLPRARAAWESLLAETSVTPGADFDATWVAVQSSLRSAQARSIARLSDNGRRRVVFLIHGFNNTHAESSDWYRAVENDIRGLLVRHGELSPVVVKVYWDGLKQPGLPAGIWTKAQHNAPVVGVALRKLLRETDKLLPGTHPVVLFSHSTGALVAVNAVGNGSSVFNCRGEFAATCQAIESEPLPDVRRYRLGLLIPAASLDTFQKFDAAGSGPQLIALGTNHLDVATSKGPFSCRLLGATCMATWTTNTCHMLRDRFGSNARIKTALFEFRQSEVGEAGSTLLLWEKHGMEAQMARDRWMPFLTTVLLERAEQPDDSQKWCNP